MWRRIFFIVGLLVLTACSLETSNDGSNDGPDAPPDTPDTPEDPGPDPKPDEPPSGDNDAPFGLETRGNLPALNFPLQSTAGDGEWTMVEAFPTLPASSGFVYLAHDGATNRLYAVEKQGIIRVFDNRYGVTSTAVWLDIRNRVRDSGEMGLLGLAFDPKFASNGFFYVHYNAKSDGRTIIERYRAAADNVSADAATASEVLSLSQPYSNHNGGSIEFGPDGFLYIGLGDGGSGNDPHDYGLNKKVWYGKILRIAPHTNQPGYKVPTDNPFATATDGSKPEIWAYGLRNPWRFSFDRQTGALWVGDVGQNVWEEVDIVTRGGNYGWKSCEGLHAIGSRRELCSEVASDTVLPIVEHSHDDGWRSLTGGYVYRGSRQPGLFGRYLYGDFETGEVWALQHQAGRLVTTQKVASLPGNLSSFAQDRDGEIYALSIQGKIYRFEQNTASDQFPRKLSTTGLFNNVATMEFVSGVLPYEVNAPLWSDGLIKRRWIALPNGAQVDARDPAHWQFPNGTVLIKHFEAPQDALGALRRIETRILVKQEKRWVAYTYHWNRDQTDADWVVTGRDVDVTLWANGASSTLNYRLPGPGECMSCHTGAAGPVLGVKLSQLNRTYLYSGGMDNQLRTWNHLGLFSASLGASSAWPALAALDNSSAALDARIRSYLEVNCAICHQPEAVDAVGLDLRYAVALQNTGLLRNAERSPGRLLDSQAPEQSVLWQRIASSDPAIRMPRGSRTPDPLLMAELKTWISRL